MPTDDKTGEVADGQLPELDPELARTGRVGTDHVVDQLVPVPATPRALRSSAGAAAAASSKLTRPR